MLINLNSYVGVGCSCHDGDGGNDNYNINNTGHTCFLYLKEWL